MVRKTKTSSSACPSSKSDSSESSADETEKKTLIFLSFPIVMLFNLIKTILFELFIVIKFVYNTSSRILSTPSTTDQEDGNLEVVKGDENKGSEMDSLQLQKNHHKKAFEFISQALKIDETQNPGVYVYVEIIEMIAIIKTSMVEVSLWELNSFMMSFNDGSLCTCPIDITCFIDLFYEAL